MFPRAVSPIALLALLPACFVSDLRDRHAAVVDAWEPAPFADTGQPFTDPKRALGPPDGRTVTLGIGAVITLRFFREIRDGPGPDVRVYGVGPAQNRARVAASRDGVTFHELPAFAIGPKTEFDLGSIGEDAVLFVRVRGVDDFGAEAGFNLDAVESLH